MGSRGASSTALWWRLVLAAFVFLVSAQPAAAHDIPGEVRLHAFAKPEETRLHVLLRVPLALLLNIDLPKQGPGYLALAEIDEGVARAVAAADKDIRWLENGRPLALVASTARISLPTDSAFGSYGTALALVHGPRLPTSEYVFWNQGYFDVHLEYAIESPRSAFTLDFRVSPGLRDRLKLDLRYLTVNGGERAYILNTAQGPIVLDPRWHQAAWTFLVSGFEHILLGTDHLLFLLCLVLPFRRVDGYLISVVTAFTVAHSITLIGAAYGLAPRGPWFAPLVEVLIASSILYMAIENVLRPRPHARWAVSAIFGLVHGFGFSFMLQNQLQFAGSNLLVSLLAFNVGVEVGQFLVLLVVLATLGFLRRHLPESERALAIVVCALAGHVAWHWLLDRSGQFAKVVEFDAASVPTIGVALAALLALGWVVRRALPRRPSALDSAEAPSPPASRPARRDGVGSEAGTGS